MSDEQNFADLLSASKAGSVEAWSQLVRHIYKDLRRIAHVSIGGRQHDITLNTTALVSECYIRLVGASSAHVSSRAHFMNLAGRVMRQVLCDYARERLATKRGGGQKHEPLSTVDGEEFDEAARLVELDILLSQLDAENPLAARSVECRYFAGLSDEDTATVLGVSKRTAQRLWQFARTWLSEHMTP
jgi:RNA polymerase sigma factor (TIGR02999 family)